MFTIHNKQERGSMSVEVVLMLPILVLFTLLVVAGGRYVSVRADIEAAARDAARAASFERTYDDAAAAADKEATNALDTYSRLSDCKVERLGGDFKAGGIVKVTLDCEVPNDGLGLIGLHGSQSMKATGSAPLETYRRTG
jgi:Flp pilus assembly protein TadG